MREVPLLMEFDRKRVVGSVCLNEEALALLGTDKYRLAVAGILQESHMEGEVRVIDKMDIMEVAIIPAEKAI